MANISCVDASIPKIKSVHFGKSGEEDPEGRVWNRCEKIATATLRNKFATIIGEP